MYVQIDTLFLADAFDIYTITCLKIYQFDSANFFSAPGLPWQKDQIKSRSFKWYQFVINGIKCIRGGICHSIYQYAKANNKCMKDYDKNKELSDLQYRDVNNLYG